MWKLLKWLFGLSFAIEIILTIVELSSEQQEFENLRQTDPQQYLIVLRKKNELKWFQELKQINPERYQIEFKIKVNAARALPASDIAGNFKAYTELAKLEPDNEQFSAKVDLYRQKLEDIKKNSKQCNADRKREAWLFSQYAVKEQLKSPSTAKFSSYGNSNAIYYSNCEFKIEGYVDSQNGFGALIRSSYTAVVKPTPSGWSVQRINIK